MFLRRRPDATVLSRVLARARELPLSYAPVGLARGDARPPFRVEEERLVLGYGADVFTRAVAALEHWRQFDLGWAGVYPSRPHLVTGTDVLVVARHVGFWSVNACRVVYLLDAAADGRSVAWSGGQSPLGGDSPRKVAGFAYGTLTEHAETGEEIFQVSIDSATGEVIYVVRAVSRERAPLARLGFPIARALQRRFRRDSGGAMRHAVATLAR
jgi:uncharacterized protein (UPF0548 family)